MFGSPAIPRVGTKMVPIGPQRLGLFGRLYRALRNTKYGRLLLELMTRTLGCLILAGLQHPGPLRGPPTAGPTLAMTNLPAAGAFPQPLSFKRRSSLCTLQVFISIAPEMPSIPKEQG